MKSITKTAEKWGNKCELATKTNPSLLKQLKQDATACLAPLWSFDKSQSRWRWSHWDVIWLQYWVGPKKAPFQVPIFCIKCFRHISGQQKPNFHSKTFLQPSLHCQWREFCLVYSSTTLHITPGKVQTKSKSTACSHRGFASPLAYTILTWKLLLTSLLFVLTYYGGFKSGPCGSECIQDFNIFPVASNLVNSRFFVYLLSPQQFIKDEPWLT